MASEFSFFYMGPGQTFSGNTNKSEPKQVFRTWKSWARQKSARIGGKSLVEMCFRSLDRRRLRGLCKFRRPAVAFNKAWSRSCRERRWPNHGCAICLTRKTINLARLPLSPARRPLPTTVEHINKGTSPLSSLLLISVHSA